MIPFHAVMIDETGCEFGVDIEASSKSEAYEKLREDYPESRCDQLESPEETSEREAAMYRRLELEMFGDDECGDEYADECGDFA